MVLGFVMASMLATANSSDCFMQPPPLALEVFKTSKDIKAFVVDSPKSASILLKDGSLIRVVSMACADSGAVAQILLPNPPAVSDMAAWRKLLARLIVTAFGTYGTSMAAWIRDARFEQAGQFVLYANGGEDPQFEITIDRNATTSGDVVTLSYRYN